MERTLLQVAKVLTIRDNDEDLFTKKVNQALQSGFALLHPPKAKRCGSSFLKFYVTLAKYSS
jgi:hypothetical protein